MKSTIEHCIQLLSIFYEPSQNSNLTNPDMQTGQKAIELMQDAKKVEDGLLNLIIFRLEQIYPFQNICHDLLRFLANQLKLDDPAGAILFY